MYMEITNKMMEDLKKATELSLNDPIFWKNINKGIHKSNLGIARLKTSYIVTNELMSKEFTTIG